MQITVRLANVSCHCCSLKIYFGKITTTVDSLITHGSHAPSPLSHKFFSPLSWFTGKSTSEPIQLVTTTITHNPYPSGGKGGAGFESAISGRLVSPAIRPFILFYFMSILGYLWPGWTQIKLVHSLRHFAHIPSNIAMIEQRLVSHVTVTVLYSTHPSCRAFRLDVPSSFQQCSCFSRCHTRGRAACRWASSHRGWWEWAWNSRICYGYQYIRCLCKLQPKTPMSRPKTHYYTKACESLWLWWEYWCSWGWGWSQNNYLQTKRLWDIVGKCLLYHFRQSAHHWLCSTTFHVLDWIVVSMTGFVTHARAQREAGEGAANEDVQCRCKTAAAQNMFYL